jgi:hypothetical protein
MDLLGRFFLTVGLDPFRFVILMKRVRGPSSMKLGDGSPPW